MEVTLDDIYHLREILLDDHKLNLELTSKTDDGLSLDGAHLIKETLNDVIKFRMNEEALDGLV